MTLDEKVQALVGVRDLLTGQVAQLKAERAALDAETVVLTHVNAALDLLIARVMQDSVGNVEQLVTYGLRTVFDDLDLAFKLAVSNKRGAQWADLVLTHGGVEAGITEAFGGGPAVVVAFLLRLLVCRRLGLAPVILLDEPFAFVSAKYRMNVGKLLRELAEAAGVTILLVTHETEDLAYLGYASHAYEAVDGGSRGNTFTRVTT